MVGKNIMRSDRLEAIEELRRLGRVKVKGVMGEYHTMGYSDPVWPEEAVEEAERIRVEHESMLRSFDDIYAVGNEAIEKERQKLRDMFTEIHREWLEVGWLHKPEGKDVIVSLAMLIASHLGGKVYRAQLAKYMYFLNYTALINRGFSVTDLVWFSSEPRRGSVMISSCQLDMMSESFESKMTISNPSMRSSYIATKEKPRKISKDLDSLVGDGGFADMARSLIEETNDDTVLSSLPVKMWRRGYRPDGDRLMLEKCMLWDKAGRFSNALSPRPREYFLSSCSEE